MSKLANDLGRFLKTTRELSNLPIQQKDLAKRVGVSNSYYSDIERGKRFPSYRILRRICASLDISISYAEQIAKDGLFARWKGCGD